MKGSSTVSSPRAARVAIAAMSALVLLVAVTLRFWSAAGTQVQQPIRGDAADYVAYAYNLEKFSVYSKQPTWTDTHAVVPAPDAMRPPLYPLLLSAVLDGVPDAAFVQQVMWLQAMLGVVVVMLAWWLARRVLSPASAVAVAALVALSPHLISHESLLLTETLYALLMMVVLLLGSALIRAVQTRGKGVVVLGALLGVVLGMAALTRSTLEHLPWVVALVALLLPERRRHLKAWLPMLIAFVLVLGGWKLRNLIVLGQTSDASLAIGTLIHGSYPWMMLDGRPGTLGYPYIFDPAMQVPPVSLGEALGLIVAKFRAEPADMFAWYLVGKPVQFLAWEIVGGWQGVFTFPLQHSPMLDQPVFRAVEVGMRGLHWPLMLLAVAGSAFALLGWSAIPLHSWQLAMLRWMALLFLYLIAFHVLVAPYPRYSIPFRPLIYVLAVFGALRVGRWLVR